MAAAAAKQRAQKTETYITSEELQKHNTVSDLWISVNGNVYDVTEWLKSHPGGDLPLLALAGDDATDAFVAFHPAKTWNLLNPFLVGRLADYTVSDLSKDYRLLVAEFSKLGLFDQKGLIPFFSLSLMSLLLVSAVLGVLFTDSFAIHLLCGGLIGFLWIQSGWMGHDSGHHRIVSNPRFNRLVQVLSGNCLTGISIGWWKKNHNFHHIACNSLDFDPDLQHLPLFAVSRRFFASMNSFFYDRKMVFDTVARFLVSYQHFTFYPVMCFARVNLLAQSLLLLLSRKKVPNRLTELAGVGVFFVWYSLLVCFLPNWGEKLTFVIASSVVTGIQHVQFCLNHFSSNVYVGPPTGKDWFMKQTTGTLNISCSRWMDWFHGGLQFQIEHHLFPRLPRCHLRRISPFVRDLCKKHSLPYSVASFWEANAMTMTTLRTAAQQARDIANPVPKNLVWEAMNTQG